MEVINVFSNFFGWLAGFFVSFGDLSIGAIRDFVGGHRLNFPLTNLSSGATASFWLPSWGGIKTIVEQIPLVGGLIDWFLDNITQVLYTLFDLFWGVGDIYNVPVFSFQFLGGGLRCVLFMLTVIMLVKLIYSLLPI